jgi:hypothetical protein
MLIVKGAHLFRLERSSVEVVELSFGGEAARHVAEFRDETSDTNSHFLFTALNLSPYNS